MVSTNLKVTVTHLDVLYEMCFSVFRSKRIKLRRCNNFKTTQNIKQFHSNLVSNSGKFSMKYLMNRQLKINILTHWVAFYIYSLFIIPSGYWNAFCVAHANERILYTCNGFFLLAEPLLKSWKTGLGHTSRDNKVWTWRADKRFLVEITKLALNWAHQ